MRYLLCLVLAATGWGAGPDTATITGRVFDTYHRPVPEAQVVTIQRQVVNGEVQLVPGNAPALVDQKGMYRLSVPAGRYLLAVTPPPNALDFATVFPAYLGDVIDAAQAPTVEVRAGELRPFVDFLLIEVDSHRISGRVEDIPRQWGGAAVTLSNATGYTKPLHAIMTDMQGRFQFDHVPAGAYQLEAFGPVARIVGLDVIWGHGESGSVQLHVSAPEVRGVRIHLRPVTR